MQKTIHIIVGSTRQKRAAEPILGWLLDQAAKQSDTQIKVVDLKEIALPAFDAPISPAYAPSDTPHGKAWGKLVSEMDAVLFLTPEYNRSIPSSLKNAIDYLAPEWKDKPAAIMSYGYIDGGGSASKHLKDVLGWLKVKLVDPSVHIQLTSDMFAEDGSFKDIQSSFAGHEQNTHNLIKNLSEAITG